MLPLWVQICSLSPPVFIHFHGSCCLGKSKILLFNSCHVVAFVLCISFIILFPSQMMHCCFYVFFFFFRCRTSTRSLCSRTTSMLPTLTLPEGVLLWSWYGSTGSTSQWRARRSPPSGIPNNCVFITNSVSRKVKQTLYTYELTCDWTWSHLDFTSHKL